MIIKVIDRPPVYEAIQIEGFIERGFAGKTGEFMGGILYGVTKIWDDSYSLSISQGNCSIREWKNIEVGDWLLKDAEGHIRHCKKEKFELKYLVESSLERTIS